MVYNTSRGGPRKRATRSNLKTEILVPSSVSINKRSCESTSLSPECDPCLIPNSIPYVGCWSRVLLHNTSVLLLRLKNPFSCKCNAITAQTKLRTVVIYLLRFDV